MRLLLLALFAMNAFSIETPLVKQPAESEWKVSGTLPQGVATHEYHLVYENKATGGIQTLVRFSKGYALAAHTHSHDETLIVLGGKLEVTLSGKSQILGPGGYAVLPAGLPHALKSVGWSGCQMVVSFSGPVDFKAAAPEAPSPSKQAGSPPL